MPRGSDKAEKPPGNWPGMKTDRLAGDFTEDVPASTQRSGGDSGFPTGFMVSCGAYCLLGCSCDNVFKAFPCPGHSRSTQESPASCVLNVAPSVLEESFVWPFAKSLEMAGPFCEIVAEPDEFVR